MNSNENNTVNLIKSIDKILVCSSIVVIFLLIFIHLYIKEYINSVSIINLIQSITAGLIPILILFIVSYFLLKKIQEIKKVTKKKELVLEVSNMIQPILEKHIFLQAKIEDIANYLTKNTMSLVQYKREQLIGQHYYDNLYAGKNKIYISGITVSNLVSSMLKENKKKNNLWNQLILKKNVSVKIMLLHPKSHFVSVLNEQEKLSENDPSPVTDKIYNTINNLEKLYIDNEDPEKLPFGSTIEIALTDEPITSSITYAAKDNSSNQETLLMGILLPHKKGGPMYKIHNSEDNQLYKDLINSFTTQFAIAKKNHMVFYWSSDKNKVFNKIHCKN